MAPTADNVASPSRQHQHQADDKEDDPDDHAKMGVGEGGDEGRQDESEDDEDDSETDHDGYLVSMFYEEMEDMVELTSPGSLFVGAHGRLLPVTRPKNFLLTPIAAAALWAIFLPMLVVGIPVFR